MPTDIYDKVAQTAGRKTGHSYATGVKLATQSAIGQPWFETA